MDGYTFGNHFRRITYGILTFVTTSLRDLTDTTTLINSFVDLVQYQQREREREQLERERLERERLEREIQQLLLDDSGADDTIKSVVRSNQNRLSLPAQRYLLGQKLSDLCSVDDEKVKYGRIEGNFSTLDADVVISEIEMFVWPNENERKKKRRKLSGEENDDVEMEDKKNFDSSLKKNICNIYSVPQSLPEEETIFNIGESLPFIGRSELKKKLLKRIFIDDLLRIFPNQNGVFVLRVNGKSAPTSDSYCCFGRKIVCIQSKRFRKVLHKSMKFNVKLEFEKAITERSTPRVLYEKLIVKEMKDKNVEYEKKVGKYQKKFEEKVEQFLERMETSHVEFEFVLIADCASVEESGYKWEKFENGDYEKRKIRVIVNSEIGNGFKTIKTMISGRKNVPDFVNEGGVVELCRSHVLENGKFGILKESKAIYNELIFVGNMLEKIIMSKSQMAILLGQSPRKLKEILVEFHFVEGMKLKSGRVQKGVQVAKINIRWYPSNLHRTYDFFGIKVFNNNNGKYSSKRFTRVNFMDGNEGEDRESKLKIGNPKVPRL